ncbi:SHOCT domain-containing protein [Pseudobutyrivibrio sp.]|uniref:SHOCT domain-containing protein n=1 Tax=Pseudobutyrivibrio sp. TaxID=2014367 RepID=UPI0025E22644|nr:SHOCT domain-containing protein [Pseudobutyrivibrio sp.]MBR5648839.1 SHOCT domain-containing protein [Pseudobutyrivibrio sp.]
MSQTKRNICIFLIILFSLGIIASMGIYYAHNSDYIIERGNVAQLNVHSILAGNLYADYSSRKLEALEKERTICKVVAITSAIGLIITIIVIASSKKSVSTTISNESSESNTLDSSSSPLSIKLNEINDLKEQGLITDEEYTALRNKILNL